MEILENSNFHAIDVKVGKLTFCNNQVIWPLEWQKKLRDRTHNLNVLIFQKFPFYYFFRNVHYDFIPQFLSFLHSLTHLKTEVKCLTLIILVVKRQKIFGNNQLLFRLQQKLLSYCSLKNSVNKGEKIGCSQGFFSRLTSKTVAVRNLARVYEIISHIKGTKQNWSKCNLFFEFKLSIFHLICIFYYELCCCSAGGRGFFTLSSAASWEKTF